MKLRVFVTAVVLVMLLIPFAPQPVSAASYCDAAQFIADVTIPDGTYMTAGTPFLKTWRLKNIGTCTWTTSYNLVFMSGDPMGPSTVVSFPHAVSPGQYVDLSVNMFAPSVAGHYRGYWKLRNASGVIFGIGTYANSWFWVDINVTVSYGTIYDFVANAPSASWSSGAGALPFPGVYGDPNGYGQVVSAPQLENGVIDSSPGLLMVPQNIYNGYIKAVYPEIAIQSGDRFQSIVNCEYGATSCYVTFRLDYQIGSGPINTFWSFKEKFEGLYYRANLDLSSLAGYNVKFILYISASGYASGDRAIWSGPKIVRAGAPIIPTPTPGPISTCDRAEFIADVTVPDGTTFSGGAAFTKTWRLKNVGTCTWTTSYELVFVGGDAMGAVTISNLPSTVVPGGVVDLSVAMTAPITSGHYIGYWKLRNASGIDFGIGASGTDYFTVDIFVSSTYSSVYDFTANACAATWTSGAGVLPCPGIDGDPKGFVLNLPSPQREDGSTGYPGLLTFPQNVVDGYIQGKYPAFAVQSGDRFQADVFCQYGATSCFVTFRLYYQIGAGPVTSLKLAKETYEGLYYHMEVDLSSLAGQNVNFILAVQSNGSPFGDRAVWSAPRIVRSGVVPSPTPTGSPPPGTPTPTAVIPGPHADLSVTINDGLSNYTPGGTATYTAVVTNTGPDAVTGATFAVVKPVQITSWTVSCVPGAGASCSAGPFTLATNISDSVNLPVGQSVTYTIVSTISGSAVGNMVTTATITSPAPVPDPNLANNTATDTDSAPSADLAVTKTDGVTSYSPGGSVTYTIEVRNNGPLNVTGASFADNKPTQVTSWTWSCVADTGASCSAGPTTTSGNYSDTVNIPVGKKVTYTVVATISPAAFGDLVNTATITAPVGTPDPVSSNNSATDTDIGPIADLSVTKTDGVTMYTPGGTVTYTIIVTNNGPQNILNGTFSDVRPGQITSWTWTCLADLGAICTAGPVSPVDFTDSVSIPAGKKVTYTVVATIAPAATGNLVNTATITSPASIPDPNLANNSATDTDSPPMADLSVTKTDGVTIYPPGATVTYTIVVTNNGPSGVVGAAFLDNIPAQVTSWIWTCAADVGAVCNPGPVISGVNYADVVDIPSGKKVTYTVVASIASPTAGDLVNTAVITAPAGITDPVASNNTATDTDAHPSADLSITKTDMVLNYVPGGSVTYTIVVTNNGPSNVVGAIFDDFIPWQIISWTWTCSPELGASCTTGPIITGLNYSDLVDIPVGKKVTYTAVASIDPLAGGPMVNTATITAPLSVPDSILVNNSATDIDTP